MEMKLITLPLTLTLTFALSACIPQQQAHTNSKQSILGTDVSIRQCAYGTLRTKYGENFAELATKQDYKTTLKSCGDALTLF